MLINLEHHLKNITTCIWKEQDCDTKLNSETQSIFAGPFKTAVSLLLLLAQEKNVFHKQTILFLSAASQL